MGKSLTGFIRDLQMFNWSLADEYCGDGGQFHEYYNCTFFDSSIWLMRDSRNGTNERANVPRFFL